MVGTAAVCSDSLGRLDTAPLAHRGFQVSLPILLVAISMLVRRLPMPGPSRCYTESPIEYYVSRDKSNHLFL
ncbi:hypothetical protein EI94DRAFT_293508 [Lactarius quietus]|nr:hypothetical protein EI94DRAFT_293508 [Lactarius quietus]